jgi:hypothetical protein
MRNKLDKAWASAVKAKYDNKCFIYSFIIGKHHKEIKKNPQEILKENNIEIISSNNKTTVEIKNKIFNSDAALIPKHHSTHNYDIFFEARDF